jgi:hypothetical protein
MTHGRERRPHHRCVAAHHRVCVAAHHRVCVAAHHRRKAIHHGVVHKIHDAQGAILRVGHIGLDAIICRQRLLDALVLHVRQLRIRAKSKNHTAEDQAAVVSDLRRGRWLHLMQIAE